MNIEQARFNMIEQQIRTWDVLDTEILELLQVVRREAFVPDAYRSLAFVDTDIPLPGGENMLPPKFEARMVQEAAARKHETVLEIGAGSGYMAALLAYRARQVTTVEILPRLKDMAAANLARAGISNVSVELGNGSAGWTSGAPYDVIVISGALEALPEAFCKQLKVGGRIAAIVGKAPVQLVKIITRVSESAFDTVTIFETNVTPLRSAPVPSHFTF